MAKFLITADHMTLYERLCIISRDAKTNNNYKVPQDLFDQGLSFAEISHKIRLKYRVVIDPAQIRRILLEKGYSRSRSDAAKNRWVEHRKLKNPEIQS